MNPFSDRWGLLAVALTLIALCGTLVLILVPAPPSPLEVVQDIASTTLQIGATSTLATNSTSTPENNQDLIVVTAPKAGATIGSSTLTVTGTARGSFYFEASFPVYLTDWDGKIIAQGVARAQGDWMTSDFVPFSATLTYTAPKGANKHGTLILRNDNPSGDPSRDKALEIPVVFP